MRTPRSARRGDPQQTPNEPWLHTLVPILLCIGVVAGIWWLTHRPQPVEMNYRVFYLVDNSGRWSDKQRRSDSGVFCQITDTVLPLNNDVSVYTYDNSARKIFCGRNPNGEKIESVINGIQRGTAQGTYPSRLLEAVMPDLKLAEALKQQVVVIMASDGEDADLGTTSALASEVSKLRCVQAFWVFGVPSGKRSDLELKTEATYRALGQRLIVTSDLSTEYGLQKVGAILASQAGQP